MNPIISEITMTIFPELANPQHTPQVMGIYPYLSDTQVKNKVIEVLSAIFEEEMGDQFTQAKLRRFLTDNRRNLINLVEELMIEYDMPDEDEDEDEFDEILVDQLLCEAVIDNFVDFIDIQDWIDAQARP